MPSLHLDDTEASRIAAYLTDPVPDSPEEPLTGGDAGRGEELIRSRGCLSCHRMEDREQPAAPDRGPAVTHLSLDGGCLAENPGPTLPRYRLDGEQRQAIREFIRVQQRFPDVSPAPVYDFYRRVRRLRCTACHVMDHFEGGEPGGAPVLTAAGEKLRLEFLKEALLDRVGLRRLDSPAHAPISPRPGGAADPRVRQGFGSRPFGSRRGVGGVPAGYEQRTDAIGEGHGGEEPGLHRLP